MKNAQLVFVAGHQRPDADAAVSAAVLARLRGRLDRKRTYQALLLGPANRQTAWLFGRARLALPPVRADIRWTVGEVMRAAPLALAPEARLGDAMALFQSKRISMVPIVDAEQRFMGVVSPRLPHNEYFFNFNVEDYLGQLLTLADVVATFALERLTGPDAVDRGEAGLGSFRVAGGSGAIERGDVVIAGATERTVKQAKRAGAQAVILADATPEEAARAAAVSRGMAVYYYPGSLLALLSSLSLAIPLRALMATDVPTLLPEQRLDQVLPVLQQARHALPVVDEEGHLLGVLSRAEAIAPAKRSLILVDHFERTQSVRGLEEAMIEEIVDHHRVGGIETLLPARVDCRPVGSSSTIVALQAAEAGQTLTAGEALLLLGALASDTLLLTSPTTTAVDRTVAKQLAKRAGVALATFGRDVLRENDELAEGAPAMLVEKDVKAFAWQTRTFGAAQVETVDLRLLTAERAAALLAALELLRVRSGWMFAALIVTDVLQGESQLLVADPEPARREWLLEDAPAAEGRRHPGMVSRKKQLLPFLFERLNGFAE